LNKAIRKTVRLIAALAVLAGLGAATLAARDWLDAHPQHNPWAPLDLRHERGWATQGKLDALAGDIQGCRAVLTRSLVAFTSLEPAGEGECSRPDRLTLDDVGLEPDGAQITCPLAAGLKLWIDQDVQRLADEILGTQVIAIDHLGTYSCRRMYGSATGNWSEHATGNAIDIGGFTLADGRNIRLISDWNGDDEKARFLRAVRDAACANFATVLSPDYNAAHADHFHFDQARRMGGFNACQ